MFFYAFLHPSHAKPSFLHLLQAPGCSCRNSLWTLVGYPYLPGASLFEKRDLPGRSLSSSLSLVRRFSIRSAVPLAPKNQLRRPILARSRTSAKIQVCGNDGSLATNQQQLPQPWFNCSASACQWLVPDLPGQILSRTHLCKAWC